MALTNTKSATYTTILHPKIQAQPGGKTVHFRLRRPFREIITICRQLYCFSQQPKHKSHISKILQTSLSIPQRGRKSQGIVSVDVTIASVDVTSLSTNIAQEEGIATVCNACEQFHKNNPIIPSRLLTKMLRLILQENSFQFITRPWPKAGVES